MPGHQNTYGTVEKCKNSLHISAYHDLLLLTSHLLLLLVLKSLNRIIRTICGTLIALEAYNKIYTAA